MWIYASVYGTDKPLILYDYQPSRGGYNCRNFLGSDFSGYLMTDGFTGYNKMENAKRQTCADHVRRKWFEAIRDKSGPLNYDDPAVVGFMAINKIYQEEALLKGKDPDSIKAERLKKQKPKWDAFKKWFEKLDPSGGSALRKAVNYTQNNWDKQNADEGCKKGSTLWQFYMQGWEWFCAVLTAWQFYMQGEGSWWWLADGSSICRTVGFCVGAAKLPTERRLPHLKEGFAIFQIFFYKKCRTDDSAFCPPAISIAMGFALYLKLSMEVSQNSSSILCLIPAPDFQNPSRQFPPISLQNVSKSHVLAKMTKPILRPSDLKLPNTIYQYMFSRADF